MPNRNYLAGRRSEWALQKLFRDAGYAAMRTAGSHSFADVIVTRCPDDAMALNRPITIQDMDNVLTGWREVSDRDLILPGFMYGRKQYKARGGTVMLHMAPATVWVCQLKSTKGE